MADYKTFMKAYRATDKKCVNCVHNTTSATFISDFLLIWYCTSPEVLKFDNMAEYMKEVMETPECKFFEAEK